MSICGDDFDEMNPWNTHTRHIQPSPKIWFETKHFEILSFRAPGLVSREKILWNFTI